MDEIRKWLMGVWMVKQAERLYLRILVKEIGHSSVRLWSINEKTLEMSISMRKKRKIVMRNMKSILMENWNVEKVYKVKKHITEILLTNFVQQMQLNILHLSPLSVYVVFTHSFYLNLIPISNDIEGKSPPNKLMLHQ